MEDMVPMRYERGQSGKHPAKLRPRLKGAMMRRSIGIEVLSPATGICLPQKKTPTPWIIEPRSSKCSTD